jgi:hypothetical protein
VPEKAIERALEAWRQAERRADRAPGDRIAQAALSKARKRYEDAVKRGGPDLGR